MTSSQPDKNVDESFDGEQEILALFENEVPIAPGVITNDLFAMPTRDTKHHDQSSPLTLRTAIAMGVLLTTSIALFAVVWLRPTTSFAEVQEKVAATKSVRYVSKTLGERANDDVRYAERMLTEARGRLSEMETKLTNSPNEKIEDIQNAIDQLQESKTLAEDYLKHRGDAPPVERVSVLGRYRMRQERTAIEGNIVSISNMKTGKSISINHKRRSALIFTKQMTIKAQTGAKTDKEISRDLTVDFYSRIRDVPENATKLSQSKLIDGKKHVGFRVSVHEGAYTWTRTFWVNEETKLPRQIDISARSDKKGYAPSDAVITDIEFDVPLDESLFSTDPPAGYTVRESGFANIE